MRLKQEEIIFSKARKLHCKKTFQAMSSGRSLRMRSDRFFSKITFILGIRSPRNLRGHETVPWQKKSLMSEVSLKEKLLCRTRMADKNKINVKNRQKFLN